MYQQIRTTLRPLPSADYVLYQLFMRDAEDRMTLSTFTDPEQGFEQAMEARLAPNVHSWQLRRWNGERMVMQAVSANWFTIQPKKVMKRHEAAETEIVDGLWVETGLDGRVCIYLKASVPGLHDTYLKITRGRYLVTEGNVTPENYQGFLRAVALAPRYMTNP